jgi:hypothetical protein
MIAKYMRIIVDLDGTLCDIAHRKHHIEKDKPDWKSFNHPDNVSQDKINHWCVHLIQGMMFNGMFPIFVTGRMAEPGVREATEEWLRKALDLPPVAFGPESNFKLFMREAGDYRSDEVMKKEIYQQSIEPYYHIVFCVDDRARVVNMWRELGLVCLQCDKGDF